MKSRVKIKHIVFGIILISLTLGAGLVIKNKLAEINDSANSGQAQNGSSNKPAETSFNKFIVSSVDQNPGLKLTEVSDSELEGLNYVYRNYYGNLSIVNASGFKSDIEVYERVYLSRTQSGAFIQAGKFNYEGKEFNSALMRSGTGGLTYRIITGIKNQTHGYYLSVEIPNLSIDLTSSEKDNALRFELYPEHKIFLNLLLDISKENLDDSLFKTPALDTSAVNKFSEASVQFGGGKFPTTF